MSQPRSKWTTPKGTDLFILNLRGKEYLPVAQRIVWFREEHPLGRIDTECLKLDDKMAHYRATISVPAKINNTVDGTWCNTKLADADKIEHKSDFGDYAEKAQTAAIGRALALCGYGTAFCGEDFEEGERIVDGPTVLPKANVDAPKEATLHNKYSVKTAQMDKITPAQWKELTEMAANSGWTPPGLRSHMELHFNTSKPSDLNIEQYNQILNNIQNKDESKTHTS